MDTQKTAAIIVVGNEILSGRTQDKNINYIAKALAPRGVALREVRIVPDVEDKIIRSIHDLQDQVDYIFTSGGIGPTHDDITAECVAKAHDVPLESNEEAYTILLEYYGEAEFTKARQKMTQMPVGARLIPNSVTAAPGFIIGKTHVMAGVPKILQAMKDHVVGTIEAGAIMHSRNVHCALPESVIAQGLEKIQKNFPSVEIGSYPKFLDNGDVAVNVVMRSVDDALLEDATKAVEQLVDSL